jgi:hypothetical protein
MFVTPYLNPAALRLPAGPAVQATTFDLDTASTDEALNATWAICNSYPDEMFCAAEHQPIVEEYRSARHRSLCMGDFIVLTDGKRTLIYKITDTFELLQGERLRAEGWVSVRGRGWEHNPECARLLSTMAELDRQVIADCLEAEQ